MVGYLGLGEQVGPYRVDAELGRGGMGTVYRATQAGLNRPVALKILDPRLAADHVFVERFHREAAILASLDSPHIIQIFDHGEIDGNLYLATQYVAGGDLHQLVRSAGPLRPETALLVYGQILSALRDAHAGGIVHRDVKPSNVLLRADNDEPFAYLCDFGIAKAQDTGLTETGAVAGSWAYLSPERHSGEPASAQSDIYSAACVLWFMLTGRGVYTGTDVEVAVSHLNAAIPQLRGVDPLILELNGLFRTCLAKDPAERPLDAAAALAASRLCLPLAHGTIPLDLNSPDSGIFRTTRNPGGPGLAQEPTPTPDSAAALGVLAPSPMTTPTDRIALVSPIHPERSARSRLPWLIGAGLAAIGVLAAATVLILPTPARSALGSLSPATARPAATPTPSPTARFLCWDGTAADQLADCGAPSGKAGLWWVYPSLRDGITECEYVPYRETTDTYDCVIDTFGLVRYRYWNDVAEAEKHYSEKYATADESDLTLDGRVVGSLFRSPKKVDGAYVMSGHWLDGHFSFSIEAPTKAQREQLFTMLSIRAYDQLAGMPTDSPVRAGRIG